MINNLKNIFCDLKKWCTSYNGYINEAYFNSLTISEQVSCLFWIIKEYLEKSSEIIDGFNDLYTFVNNYFKNLDVQEEINNKINEMIDNGDLQEIFSNMFGNPIICFDNVEQMKNYNLSLNQICKTLEYYEGSGIGGAYYKITNNTHNGFNSILLNNGKTAELILGKKVNLAQLGAKFNTPEYDSTSALQFAIDNYDEIYIDEGNIYISTVNILKPQKKIYGSGFRKTIIYAIVGHNESPLFYISNSESIIRYIDLSDFSIDGQKNSQITQFSAIKFDNVNINSLYAFADIFIKRMYIINFSGYGIEVRTKYVDNPTEYFIQYLRVEEVQIAYCLNNIYCENTYYLQLINSYFQFADKEGIVLTKQSNYFKILDCTINSNENYYLLSILNSRFGNILMNNLQSSYNAIGIDNCSNFNISGNIGVNTPFLVETLSQCAGTITSNNIYNGKVINDKHNSYFVITSNYGNNFLSDNKTNAIYGTGFLSDRINCSYSGEIPNDFDNLTLDAQNIYLQVSDNTIYPPINTRAILLFCFNASGDGNITLSVNGEEKNINLTNNKNSYTLMWYLNNINNIQIKIKSSNTSNRFNGGIATYLNLTKY